MRKFITYILVFLTLCSLFGCAEGVNEEAGKETEENISETKPELFIEIVDMGEDLYTAPKNGAGYRYGPSLIYYENDEMDMWCSRPGNNSTEWDYIAYRHFDGKNWSDEQVVLKPDKGSLDKYSVCDPGVICFNGYYYLAYTSTFSEKEDGFANSAFVARAKSPEGPYEKWDGEGWGGSPVPFILFEGSDDEWGIGEVSFTIKDDTLFVYYSWNVNSGMHTRVGTADLSENWPATFKDQGVALAKPQGGDSLDVAYVDEYDCFLAVAVKNRFLSDSSIWILQSADGLKFTPVGNLYRKTVPYAHNIGISKRPDGHIDRLRELFISYAYGDEREKWGRWSMVIQEIKIIEKEKKK